MCNAYAETGLLVFIYRICSRCLISIDLTVWPTYDLLHVLHCNLYIPLEFVSFCGDLSHCWLYMVLHVRNAIFRSVRFNRLVTLCVSGLWYVNMMHFFLCVCVAALFVFCVLIILWMICNGKPLFLVIVQIVSNSCCLVCSVIEEITFCLCRSCTLRICVQMDGYRENYN
jgi:hypothetical protein